MKKIPGIILLVLVSASVIFPLKAFDWPALQQPPVWKKVKGQKWPGQPGSWLKLNEGNYVLMVSTDGKKWEPVKEKKWQDKSGEWLMLKGRKIVWSADGLKGWAEVPEWKWVAVDGRWYKFDKEWTLWVLEEKKQTSE